MYYTKKGELTAAGALLVRDNFAKQFETGEFRDKPQWKKPMAQATPVVWKADSLFQSMREYIALPEYKQGGTLSYFAGRSMLFILEQAVDEPPVEIRWIFDDKPGCLASSLFGVVPVMDDGVMKVACFIVGHWMDDANVPSVPVSQLKAKMQLWEPVFTLEDAAGDAVFALLWYMTQETVLKRETELKPMLPKSGKSKAAMNVPSDVLRVRLRRVQADASNAVLSEADRKTAEWTCRWIVSSHIRRVKVKGTDEYKEVTVSEYVKGPRDKPMKDERQQAIFVDR